MLLVIFGFLILSFLLAHNFFLENIHALDNIWLYGFEFLISAHCFGKYSCQHKNANHRRALRLFQIGYVDKPN